MNLKRRKFDVIQATDVDCPSLRRESRPVKRMDPAVSTEVVCRGPGVELVGGQGVLAGDDSELFYLRLLVECPLSLAHRAVTLGDRLDFGFNFKGDAPAMTGPSVCRHELLPTSDARLTLREDARRAKPALPRIARQRAPEGRSQRPDPRSPSSATSTRRAQRLLVLIPATISEKNSALL